MSIEKISIFKIIFYILLLFFTLIYDIYAHYIHVFLYLLLYYNMTELQTNLSSSSDDSFCSFQIESKYILKFRLS